VKMTSMKFPVNMCGVLPGIPFPRPVTHSVLTTLTHFWHSL
jgi:hypothetical protein